MTAQSLTSRERVKLAIGHRHAGKIVKGEICIDDEAVAQSLHCREVDFTSRLAFVRKLGLDMVCLHPDFPTEKSILPQAGACACKDLKRWVRETDLFLFAVLDGVFGWGTRLMGFEEFITLPGRSPLNFTGLIEEVENLNTELAVMLEAQGVDGIILADDLAYQNGLLMDPAVLRKHLFPSLHTQVRVAGNGGTPVFFHCDGNLNEIMGDIAEAGFCGLHCIDKNSGMDIFELQRSYAGLCLWGSVSVEDVARAGDAAFLRSLLEDIATLGAQGGFILGTSSGIFSGMDMENLMAIYGTFM